MVSGRIYWSSVETTDLVSLIQYCFDFLTVVSGLYVSVVLLLQNNRAQNSEFKPILLKGTDVLSPIITYDKH